jgi:hypothetical protein
MSAPPASVVHTALRPPPACPRMHSPRHGCAPLAVVATSFASTQEAPGIHGGLVDIITGALPLDGIRQLHHGLVLLERRFARVDDGWCCCGSIPNSGGSPGASVLPRWAKPAPSLVPE